MLPDDELCLCFHVSWRKVIRYIQIHRVSLPSQVSECQGAGTGCGWCRTAIARLVVELHQDSVDSRHLEQWLSEKFPSSRSYRDGRSQHIKEGHGIPPRS